MTHGGELLQIMDVVVYRSYNDYFTTFPNQFSQNAHPEIVDIPGSIGYDQDFFQAVSIFSSTAGGIRPERGSIIANSGESQEILRIRS